SMVCIVIFFFFQAEDGIRDRNVTGVQTCALPISLLGLGHPCAFGGTNRNQASFFMLQPVGRSVYNALQMKLSQNMTNPFRGVKRSEERRVGKECRSRWSSED